MKTRIFFLLAAVFMATSSQAQPKLPAKKDIDNFYKSTTYVLLNNDLFGTYNSRIKEAVKNYWTLTDARYINKDEFKKKRKFPLASFIVETTTHFEDQKKLGVFSSLSILGGHTTGSLDRMPDLATLPLAYDDVDYDEYYYKLGLALKFMQNHIEWLNKNPNTETKLLFEHYKNQEKKQQTKLYIYEKQKLKKTCKI